MEQTTLEGFASAVLGSWTAVARDGSLFGVACQHVSWHETLQPSMLTSAAGYSCWQSFGAVRSGCAKVPCQLERRYGHGPSHGANAPENQTQSNHTRPLVRHTNAVTSAREGENGLATITMAEEACACARDFGFSSPGVFVHSPVSSVVFCSRTRRAAEEKLGQDGQMQPHPRAKRCPAGGIRGGVRVWGPVCQDWGRRSPLAGSVGQQQQMRALFRRLGYSTVLLQYSTCGLVPAAQRMLVPRKRPGRAALRWLPGLVHAVGATQTCEARVMMTRSLIMG